MSRDVSKFRPGKGVSVVICCYNSSGRITPTLESLQKISAGDIPWEVILVDNNSSDNTSTVARRVWDKLPVTTFKIVTEKSPGLMKARIAGVNASMYDYVSFIDDDNWISDNWINKVFSILERDEDIVACGGSSEGVYESHPPQWFSHYEPALAVGSQQSMTGYVSREKGFLWGAGLTVRKTAWREIFESGFKSFLEGRKGKVLNAGEDSEINLLWTLKGHKLFYDESLKLKHYIPSGRLSYDYLAKIYEGFGKAEVVLSLYREYIKYGKAIHPLWIVRCISALKNMVITGFKFIFSSGNLRLKNSLLWKHNKAYLLELICNRDKYLKLQLHLKHIHQNSLKKF